MLVKVVGGETCDRTRRGHTQPNSHNRRDYLHPLYGDSYDDNRSSATMATTESVPTAEDKAKYDAAKKELQQAILKKRQADKQLVCIECCVL